MDTRDALGGCATIVVSAAAWLRQAL